MADRRYSVTIDGDVRPYVGALDQASSRTNQFAGDAEKAGQRASQGFSRSAVSASIMSGSIQRIAETATGFFAGDIFIRGARRIADGIQSIIIGGSDLTETINKADVTFGAATVTVTAGADQMAKKFGVAKGTFIDAASSLGLIGKAAGLSQADAAQMATSLAKLAADATSFYNVPLPDVLDAIQSGLVGEVRPLRQYAVLLSEAAVQQEAVRLGIAATGAQLTDQQKVVARASLIQKGLADANGDLELTQGTLANKLRAIKGDITNWADEIGQKAQPAVLGLLDGSYRLGHDGLEVLQGIVARLSPFFSNMARAGEDVIHVLGVAASTVAPLVAGLGELGGIGVIAVLNALATSLAAVTGFLAQNEIVVKALTAALVASLLPAIGRTVASFASLVADKIATGMFTLAGGVDAASAALRGEAAAAGVAAIGTTEVGVSAATSTSRVGEMVASLGLLRTAIAAISVVGLVLAYTQMTESLQKSKDAAKEQVEQLREGANLKTPQGLRDYIAATDQATAAAKRQFDQRNDASDFFGHLAQGFSDLNRELHGQPTTYEQARQALSSLTSEGKNARQMLATLEGNLGRVTSATGLTDDGVLALANKLGIDLTKAGDGGIATLIAAANAAKTAGEIVGGAVLELSEAEKAAQSATAQIVGPDVAYDRAQQAHQAAQQASKDAEQQTRDAEQHAKQQAKAAEDAAKQPLQIAQAQLGVRQAVLQVDEAEKSLRAARDQQARTGEVVIKDERDLEAARDAETRAVFALLDAERALEDARRQAAENRQLTEAGFAVARARDAQASAAEDLTQAEQKLAAAQDHGTPLEVAQSERELAEARRRVTETSFDTEDAEAALQRTRQDTSSGRAVQEAELGVQDAQRQSADAADSTRDAQRALDQARLDQSSTDAVQRAELNVQQALLGVQQAQQSLADAQKGPGADAMDTFKSKTDDAKVSLQDWKTELQNTLNDYVKFNDNLTFLAQNGAPPVVIEAFRSMGQKGVDIVALLRQQMGGDASALGEIFSEMVATAITQTEQWQHWVTVRAEGGSAAANYWTADMVNGMAAKLGVTPEQARTILEKYLGVIDSAFQAAAHSTGAPPPPSSLADLLNNAGGGGAGPSSGNPGGTLIPPNFGGGGGGTLATQATGGVYGAASEQHIAQVAAPGTWRLWAEDPKSGKEAYIPERGSAARGLAILNEAASWYGATVVTNAVGRILVPEGHVTGGGTAGIQLDAAVHKIHDMAQAYVDHLVNDYNARTASTATRGRPEFAGPVPPGQLSDWLNAGIALGGKPADWLSGMYRLTMAESGGNPHSYNPTPVGSEHAEGLLQMLPSTFRAHMVPGHGDIWNPIDNTASSVGYIGGRYGSVYNTPLFKGGPYKGYASGGILAQVLDAGGYLPPGWSLAGNFTGRPEPVGAGAGAGAGVVVNVAPNAITWDFRGLAVASVDELDKRMRSTASETVELLSERLVEALEGRGVR